MVAEGEREVVAGRARVTADLSGRIDRHDAASVAAWLDTISDRQLLTTLDRLDAVETAVVFRLLQRDRAIAVFEDLLPAAQQRVLDGLRDDRVIDLLEALDPDDRARLLDEMPAKVAKRLLGELSPAERALTTILLGYPEESAGRLMTPEFVSLRQGMTAPEAIAKVRRDGAGAETVYALPVLDDRRHLVGIVGLRALVMAASDMLVADLMTTDVFAVHTDTDQEVAARLVADEGLIVLPVVDSEHRLVGVITFDDAMDVLGEEESEDFALVSGRSHVNERYLSASVFRMARARALWLLVLIVGATLTVNVLQVFEATLQELTVLALFVPLLIGTGGNSGAQATSAVIRALALGEVRFSDLPRIVWREARVGFLLGAMLAVAAFVPVAAVWDVDLAWVVSLTLISICTWATIAGSALPLLARKFGVDPAVVSAPFITTLVDASGLVLYFTFAKIVLGL